MTNNGLWDMQSDAGLSYAGGSVSNFVNSSTGTFRKSGGSGVTAVGNNVHFVNSGTIDAQTGTIDFAGGSATFQGGTQFTGAGVNRVSTNATFVDDISSANLVLAGGVFTGGGAAAGAVLHGSTQWTGGQILGAWQVASGQTLVAKDGANKDFSAVGFINHGNVVWQSSERVGFASAAVVTNNGLWDVQSDADLSYAGGSASTFVNNGTFRKSGGSGVTEVGNNVGFANNGVLQVVLGTVQFAGNLANPGTVTGGGRVQTNVLTNSGHVAPGNGVGALYLTGSFAQTALGSLDIQLGAAGAHDLFVVTGASSLAGTLALSCVGDCRYDVDDELLVLSSGGALSGTFGAVTYSGFRTGEFAVLYGDHDVRLKVLAAVTPVPEPGTWATLLAGLGLLGLLAARRRRA